MKYSGILTTCAIWFCSTGIAQENLVVNGTFDLQVPWNGTGGGWTSANLDDSGGWALYGDDYVFILNSSGSAQSDPSISQTLSGLTVGREYQIKGEYCNRYGFIFCGDDVNPSFGVQIDDTIVLELPYVAECFTPFEAYFIATAAEQTLRISAERNGLDCDYAVDNISVMKVVVIFGSSFEG